MAVRVREKTPGTGVYWLFINHKGKRTSRQVGSQKAALKAKEIIEAKLKLGESYLGEEKALTPTLEKYYERFKRIYLDTAAVRFTTRRGYESTFRNYLLPAFKSKRLDEIHRESLQEFIASLVQRNLAKDTIRLIIVNLSTVLNHAKEAKVLVENPAARLGKFFREAHKRHEEISPLTREEVPLFLQATLKHSPACYPLFLCAIHAGLRPGELAGLPWGDIDFHAKFIIVRRNVVFGRVGLKTKTGKKRNVDASDELLTVLHELKRTRKEEWLAKGQNEIPDWVFCNGEGNPADMQNLYNRHFLKCLEKAGIRRLRLHDLRHTFASLLIQDGQSLAYVRDQLGHKSIKTTVDIYGHLVPGANRQAVNRLPSLRTLGEESGGTHLGQKNLV